MKHTLPWNVTGIPAEARELARAAAMREGISVGDWLTRRIVTENARPSPPPEFRDPVTMAPPIFRHRRDEEAKRDGDELTVQLARTEAQSDSAFRRIDEALRNLGRRLESTERTQNEAHRAMNAAATEINAATRDQAQAFTHLTERIDRVERHADTSALRDAVRGLHQGLSRLAEQIARMATESTGQISTLAGSVETLASKIATAREDSSRLEEFVEGHLGLFSERLRQAEERIAATAKLEEAIAKLEARVTASTELGATVAKLETRVEAGAALEATVAKLESRVAEGAKVEAAVAELQARVAAGAKLEETVGRLEAHVNSSEERVQDSFGRHLASIERNLEHIAARLEQAERRGGDAEGNVQDSLRNLTQRLEAAEKKNREALAELKANLNDTSKRIETVETGSIAPLMAPLAAAPAPDFDLPPFPDAPPFPTGGYEPPPPGAEFMPAPAIEAGEAFLPEPESTPSTAQDYLAQARRAAQAAAEPGPMMRQGRVSPGMMGTGLERGEGRKKGRMISGRVAAVVLALFVLAAGLLLLRSFGSRTEEVALAPTQAPVTSDKSAYISGQAPLPPDITSGLPGIGTPTPPPAPAPSAPVKAVPPAHASAILPAPQAAAPHKIAPVSDGQTRVASLSPNTTTLPPQGNAAAPANAIPAPVARLITRANAGDNKAALVLGLKYVDGDGVVANDTEAARWLKQAANAAEPVAQYRLGTLYEKGRGVPADAKLAASWYAQAAMHGNRKAMHNLAVSYADGTGNDKNFTEAARWFKSASELGLTDSQFNLAVLYERGLGVPLSLNDAYKWYAIAAAAGDAESKARIDALGTQLQPADKDAADKAVKAFRPAPMNRDANEAPTITP